MVPVCPQMWWASASSGAITAATNDPPARATTPRWALESSLGLGSKVQPPLASLLASLLALVFAWAAVAKLVRFGAWSAALGGYGLPRPLAAGARFGAPGLEAAVAGLLLGGAVQAGASLALALTLVFCAALLRARARIGRRLPCGCFGGRSAHDYRAMLALDLALTAAAVIVLASGDAAAPARLDPSAAVPAVLAAAGVGLAAWVVRQATAGMRR